MTLDLAPVADVVDPDLGEANEPVGALDRGFGTDPARVSDAVTAFVEGLDQGGVHATLKHFPGLGRVRENTDFAGAADTRTGVDDPGLASFRAGIAAGAPVVMMSSAVYERIDPDNRALFSRAVDHRPAARAPGLHRGGVDRRRRRGRRGRPTCRSASGRPASWPRAATRC